MAKTLKVENVPVVPETIKLRLPEIPDLQMFLKSVKKELI